MPDIFTEFKVKDLSIKNRVVMPAMCMYSSDESGQVRDFHLLHYTTRAMGGTGLIILEATAVERRGRISGNDLGIWEDSQIEGLKKLVDEVHRDGAKIGIQLAHAGRKNETFEDVIAPSPLLFNLKYRTPREMTQEDITAVIEAFGRAALRALKAGFDYIELHGAHGYLINEFLSPVTNERKDGYGGGAANRVRLLKEVTAKVREHWPEEKPLGLRVSAYEYEAGGNTPEDVSFMINLVKDEGIDLINVSSGGVVDSPIEVFPGYQIRYGTEVKSKTNLPVIVGGLLEHHHMANEIIRNNRGDLIFLGRELLRNPYWVLQASRKLGMEEVVWPRQYEKAKGNKLMR
ncbi:MAG: NADPH dehydrogenase [delta proteobacterium ML8_F1]|nr:MAG: NADPH dehydrogenase [delta proteobacterium ML8_F1]